MLAREFGFILFVCNNGAGRSRAGRLLTLGNFSLRSASGNLVWLVSHGFRCLVLSGVPVVLLYAADEKGQFGTHLIRNR